MCLRCLAEVEGQHFGVLPLGTPRCLVLNETTYIGICLKMELAVYIHVLVSLLYNTRNGNQMYKLRSNQRVWGLQVIKHVISSIGDHYSTLSVVLSIQPDRVELN